MMPATVDAVLCAQGGVDAAVVDIALHLPRSGCCCVSDNNNNNITQVWINEADPANWVVPRRPRHAGGLRVGSGLVVDDVAAVLR